MPVFTLMCFIFGPVSQTVAHTAPKTKYKESSQVRNMSEQAKVSAMKAAAQRLHSDHVCAQGETSVFLLTQLQLLNCSM